MKQTDKISYISLFTGIGGFELALERVFNNPECLGFSEIDNSSIEVFTKNFKIPRTSNFGCIKEFVDDKRYLKYKNLDLIFAGFPCTDLSIARGNREGLKGKNSGLFWDLIKVIKECKPKYFLVENVASMANSEKDIITKELGVEPVRISSLNFTGQKRERLYWFNWNIDKLPTSPIKATDHIDYNYIEKDPKNIIKDSKIKYKNLLSYSKSFMLREVKEKFIAWSRSTRYPKDRPSYYEDRVSFNFANTLTTGKGCGSFSSKNLVKIDGGYRILSPIECERIQGIPDNFTEHRNVSRNKRYKMIGNSVTVPVIEHIFRGLIK